MPELQDLATKLIEKLSTWLEALVVMLPNIAVALVVVIASLFAARFAEQGIYRVVRRLSGNEPVSKLLGATTRFGVVLVALFFGLGLLKLDKTVTSLLAGVGVVGLALGFAFQDIAANFMSGFMMAVRRPFDVGDLVEVAGKRGRIQHIHLRASELQKLDGLSILIPNREIFQNPITNYTSTPNRRMELAVGTAYGDDLEKVRTVVIEAVQNLPKRNMERDVELFFTEFGDSSINFVVRVWLNQADEVTYFAARSEAMIAIKKAFDKKAITIPFPIRTLDFGADAVGGTRLDGMNLRVARATAAE
jgi:small conductance mechanosensitive channel